MMDIYSVYMCLAIFLHTLITKKNGYLVESKNLKDLTNKIEAFINLTYKEKKQMGIFGREKVINEFNRSIVVDTYIKEIGKVGKSN